MRHSSSLIGLRFVLNCLNGSTLLGLLVAWAGHAKLRKGPRSLIYAERYTLKFPMARAFTLGNVIISGQDFDSLQDRSPHILTHEEKHSTQYCILGGLFLPVYCVFTGVSWLLTGDRASQNPLEKLAGLDDGGYKRMPVAFLPFLHRK